MREARKQQERETRRGGKVEEGVAESGAGDATRKEPPVEGGVSEMAAVAQEEVEQEKRVGGREGLYRARSHDHPH